MRKIYKRLQFYFKNTTLHGLGFVADERRHPIIRLLWMAVFLISGIYMFKIFYGSYQSFRYNAISFVTETTYLEWNTTFPAVTLCEIASSEIFWTPKLLFVQLPCEVCQKFNFREIAKRYRKSCDRVLKSCKWNDIPFDCCEKFLPLETEYGVCYSINSLHTAKTDGTMKSNRKTGPGELYIETIDDVRLYFHAPEDVPFINSNSDQRKDVALGEVYNVSIKIIEIDNDQRVKDVSVDKRGCRFPWEVTENMKVHKLYSYSSCVVQCHADAHQKLCNCTHHLMPVLSDEKFCDVEGLQCLTDNFEILNRLHAKGFQKPGLVCDCIPSCTEPEYKIVSEQRGFNDDHGQIRIKMHSLPTFRFKRNVVRSTMDLVVSIGGTAGLFIGASLLNVIEAPYLLFLRS